MTSNSLAAECAPSHSQPRHSLLVEAFRSRMTLLIGVWRELFQKRNYVFAHDGPPGDVCGPSSLRIERIARPDNLSAALRNTISTVFGAARVVALTWEMQHGAALWVALINGQPVGLSLSRRGGAFRRWFVPMTNADVVIFANATAPAWRGRSVCPALVRHVIANEVQPGGKAYADCRVYNRASIRSLEKAGFSRIATCRPLSRDAALGQHAQPSATDGAAPLASSALRHEVHTSFSAVSQWKREWDDLARREGDVLCTFDWYAVWWRHFGCGRRLEIHLFWYGPALVAALPLVRWTMWIGLLPLRMVQIVASDHSLASVGLLISSEYLGPVVSNLVSVLGQSGPWDVLQLGSLPSHVRSLDVLAGACAASPLTGLVVNGQRDGCTCVYTLPDSYDGYLASIAGSERRNVQRCDRRLAEKYRVEVRTPQNADELRQGLDALVPLHQALWQSKGRLGQFTEWPGFDAFFRDAVQAQAAHGRAAMVVLDLNGRTVGVECGFEFASRLYAIIRGYVHEPEWDTYSLGRVLHCAMARHAIDRGASLLDDGGGVFEYKHRLGAELRCGQSVIALRRGWHVRLRFWLAIRFAYFRYGFCRRIWIYKLHRLGFHERPIRPARLRRGFLVSLYSRAKFPLFGRRGVVETRCPDPVSWCLRPASEQTAAEGPSAPPNAPAAEVK